MWVLLGWITRFSRLLVSMNTSNYSENELSPFEKQIEEIMWEMDHWIINIR
jgi:hypothetical protein